MEFSNIGVEIYCISTIPYIIENLLMGTIDNFEDLL